MFRAVAFIAGKLGGLAAAVLNGGGRPLTMPALSHNTALVARGSPVDTPRECGAVFPRKFPPIRWNARSNNEPIILEHPPLSKIRFEKSGRERYDDLLITSKT